VQGLITSLPYGNRWSEPRSYWQPSGTPRARGSFQEPLCNFRPGGLPGMVTHQDSELRAGGACPAPADSGNRRMLSAYRFWQARFQREILPTGKGRKRSRGSRL